jgi:hypothetical protein
VCRRGVSVTGGDRRPRQWSLNRKSPCLAGRPVRARKRSFAGQQQSTETGRPLPDAAACLKPGPRVAQRTVVQRPVAASDRIAALASYLEMRSVTGRLTDRDRPMYAVWAGATSTAMTVAGSYTVPPIFRLKSFYAAAVFGLRYRCVQPHSQYPVPLSLAAWIPQISTALGHTWLRIRAMPPSPFPPSRPRDMPFCLRVRGLIRQADERRHEYFERA